MIGEPLEILGAERGIRRSCDEVHEIARRAADAYCLEIHWDSVDFVSLESK